jgi:hypothetical protein
VGGNVVSITSDRLESLYEMLNFIGQKNVNHGEGEAGIAVRMCAKSRREAAPGARSCPRGRASPFKGE